VLVIIALESSCKNMVKPVLNRQLGFSRAPEKDNYSPARYDLLELYSLLGGQGDYPSPLIHDLIIEIH
jgi:hypothetical protein